MNKWINWEEIKEEFEKREISIYNLAKKHKITRKTIYDKANKEGWIFKSKNITLWSRIKELWRN
jgi:hypothetical protein